MECRCRGGVTQSIKAVIQPTVKALALEQYKLILARYLAETFNNE